MEASVVDLRHKIKDVLKALERREKVTIFHHGKVKGIIVPTTDNKKYEKVKDHPFFGMSRNDSKSVSEEMHDLRGPRYQ